MKQWLMIAGILLIFSGVGCIRPKFTIDGELLALAASSPLPKVILRIQNLETQEVFLVSTDDDGKFSLDRVIAGKYRVSSADTTKWLVSNDTLVIDPQKGKRQSCQPLRGIAAPPATGVFVWVRGIWTELPAMPIQTSVPAIALSEAYRSPILQPSASLLIYLPGKLWETSNSELGLNWLSGTISDSVVHFAPSELRERVLKGETDPMDPTGLPEWNYSGAFPLRGPSTPGVYCIIDHLGDDSSRMVVYPFIVPRRDFQPSSATPIPLSDSNKTISAFAPSTPAKVFAPDSGTSQFQQMFQQALTNALLAMNHEIAVTCLRVRLRPPPIPIRLLHRQHPQLRVTRLRPIKSPVGANRFDLHAATATLCVGDNYGVRFAIVPPAPISPLKPIGC